MTALLRKIYSIFIILSIISFGGFFSVTEAGANNYSRQLEVSGNRLIYRETGETAVLRGANIPSLGWGNDERTLESAIESFDAWNNNVIRLNIHPTYWYSDISGKLNHLKYRALVDEIVKAAMARGKYVILDCHQYLAAVDSTLELWKDLSAVYGNNPAVLFGLLNEPHSCGFEIWRNGGTYKGTEYIGMQTLVEEIRDTGAKNILIAGGMDWSYNISDIVTGGYMLTDTGSGGDTSKTGFGIMYDTHIYPMKAQGKPADWDAKVGAMRKIAPVLVGEWGWDPDDSVVMGNNISSYDIWMNQLMQWMDDESGTYGGVPVSWTAFCMHTSSSPRMIKGDAFMPTYFCGQYIKDRLLSYESTAVLRDEEYTADFSADIFRKYEKSRASTVLEDGKLTVNYFSGEHYVKMSVPADWDMNGWQTLSFDIEGADGMTLDIGFYCTDKEIWTKTVAVNGSHVTIGIDELSRQENAETDGLLKGIESIYISGAAAAQGSYSIDNITIEKSEKPSKAARYCPYEPSGTGLLIDMDSENSKFDRMTSFVSPASDSSLYYTSGYEETEGADGNETTALKVSYNTVGASSGISTLYLKNVMNASDAKYLSVCAKGSGTAQTIVLTPNGTGGVSIEIDEGDTEWRQYIFDISQWENLGNITSIKLNSGDKRNDYYYIDNINFSLKYPAKVCDFRDRSVSYGFELNEKIIPSFLMTDCNSVEDISGRQVQGGYQSDYGYLISYTRATSTPARAVINCSNAYSSDDIKAQTALTYYVSFYAKSMSGQEEKINLSLTDPVDNVFTEDVTFTLTNTWKQYTFPIRDMPLIVSGNPNSPERIRGYRFSSAESGRSGSFIIDNIALVSNENLTNNAYTVSFESNGGTKVLPQRIESGNKVSVPEEPKRTGYVFDGWYADKECKISWDFSSKIYKDTVLYAKWIFLGTEFEAKLNGGVVVSGENVLTVKIHNVMNENRKYTAAAAVYDKYTGRFISMSRITDIIPADITGEYSLTVNVPDENSRIKLFIWEGKISDQKPLREAFNFEYR